MSDDVLLVFYVNGDVFVVCVLILWLMFKVFGYVFCVFGDCVEVEDVV